MSLRGRLYVNMCACSVMCIWEGTGRRISEAMVAYPYLFVFLLLSVLSDILEECGWIHLREKTWSLRCDAPYHHRPHITHSPENKNID